MKTKLVLIWNKWNEFWFAPIDLFPAAVFRIVFGLMALLMYSLRQFVVRDVYTDRGMVAFAEARELLPEIYRPLLVWYPAGETATVVYHAVFLLALLLLSLGVYSRLMAAVALFIQVSFLFRNYSVAYGADIIVCFWLLYMIFIRSDLHLSIQNKFKLPHLLPRLSDFSLSTVGVRLIQLQLCVIYGYTGLEKLKGGSWWEGTAVWLVMGNQQLSTMNLSFLQNFPLLVVLMTYATLIFEIYFPVMVWLKKIRPWWLAVGVFFHVGIALTMGLVFFSGAMIVAYILFINADWLRARLNLQPTRE